MLFPSFIISFLAATITTPLIIRWYKKNNWLDDPQKTKHVKVVHEKPVPRGGGLVIFCSVLIASLLFLPMTNQILGLLTGALIITVVGFIDDLKDASPYWRLVIGAIAAGFVIAGGIRIEFITHPFTSGVLEFNNLVPGLPGDFIPILLTVIWIVWTMNIVNWAKGLDGQLPGVVAIAAIFIAILGLRFRADQNQIPLLILSLSVAGAYAGLLIYNKYPQQIMPGYGGGALGGYFLAVLAIMSGAKLATLLLVLSLPTADAIFTIMRRLANKKSPFWGDRGHLHHKLIDVLGWSKQQIAWFYWTVTAVMGLIALQLKPEQKLFTIILSTAAVFGFLIWAKFFITFSKPPGRDNG